MHTDSRAAMLFCFIYNFFYCIYGPLKKVMYDFFCVREIEGLAGAGWGEVMYFFFFFVFAGYQTTAVFSG